MTTRQTLSWKQIVHTWFGNTPAQERRRYLRALCIMMLDGLLSAIPYLCAAILLGSLLRGAQAAPPYWTVLLACACPLLRLLMTSSAQTALFMEGYRVTGQLRSSLVAHAMKVPLGLLARAFPSERLSRFIVHDLRWVEEFSSFGIAQQISNALLLTALIGALGWLDLTLALLVVVLLAVAVLVLEQIGRRMLASARQQQAQLEQVSRHLGELSAGLPVLRAYQDDARIKQRFTQHNQQLRQFYQRTSWKLAPGLLLANSLFGLVMAAALSFAGWRYLDGHLDGAQLLIVLAVLSTLSQPIESLLAQRFQALASKEAMAAHAALLAHPALPDGHAEVAAGEAQIRLEQVSFGYRPGEPVLHNLDLDFPAGKTTVIVGPSGAGKSTLLQLLARFHDTSSGRILVDGQDIRAVALGDHLARISMVFQDGLLFQDSIASNIAAGARHATPEQLRAALRAAQCEAFVDAMPDGADTQLAELGRNLSGGQKQRLTIARALLKDAPIVLFDEMTSALDAENDHAIRCALRELLPGRTTIMVAHRLDHAVAADQVVVMDQGKVIDCGSHAELLRRCTLYQQLWSAWSQGQSWQLGLH
ncbi:ABC transporter ATP-binding protein [Herbaspirillum rubrisubalbicans]|uniref:ABC transporter ATP-binding protein n=1 Tax=Herbaspirillum rubrisubalbicans TaxID=80842 RepID=A0AAD0U915_9BURK|nr:ABC transporter ATP-binding protein [Herbaspirillum rubrisubalbicans]AYR24481.1 ABC transporter ATP-binding protein [Herbaspirillum rubrisubalbicans]